MSMSGLHAQDVEHNYLVGPQFTDCDSLKFDGLTTEKVIEHIRTAEFRYQQNFKLTRRMGFKGAEYFSCDLTTGLLIIHQDGEKLLFSSVSKADWEILSSSSDPEGYYLQKKDTWPKFP
jgi:hypothetical protein